MTINALLSAELTEAQFREISDLVRSLCGINLHSGKKELVKARLSKRLRELRMRSFADYVEYLRKDHSGDELACMLDALSTNVTGFFREPQHFEYLAGRAIPRVDAAARTGRKRLRIWSAGCSSGEEPYSIAITVREHVAKARLWDARILATDLSAGMLARAKKGVYDARRLKIVSQPLRDKYFRRVNSAGEGAHEVKPDVKSLVCFARLNLVAPWPMRGPFDVIFCRNVMIYFDKDTQAGLVGRFWDILAPGGALLLGHSESLAGVPNRFRYDRPTVYEKPAHGF